MSAGACGRARYKPLIGPTAIRAALGAPSINGHPRGSSILVLVAVPVPVTPAIALPRRFVFDDHDVGIPMLCLEPILHVPLSNRTGTRQPRAPTGTQTGGPATDRQRATRIREVANSAIQAAARSLRCESLAWVRMDDFPLSTFQRAIKATHGAESRLLARETIKELFRRKAVWEGEVLVFELLDHPTAHLCYAWEVDGKVTAVLAKGPVKSADDAVRASIMTDKSKSLRRRKTPGRPSILPPSRDPFI